MAEIEKLKQQIDEAWEYYDTVYKSMDMSTFNICPLLEPAWRRASELSAKYKQLTGQVYLGRRTRKGLPGKGGNPMTKTADDLDQIATILTEEATKVAREEANRNKELLLDILEHQVLGSGRVIDAARAAATPCKCVRVEDDGFEACWSPGILGLMSSKKNPEQIAQFCALGKEYVGGGLPERVKKVRSAIEKAHKRWEEKGGGLPQWWAEVAKSLEEDHIEL